MQVFHDSVLHGMFQLIYSLCKIRGYKVIVKLFPHEVADLEPALQCLLCQVRARRSHPRSTDNLRYTMTHTHVPLTLQVYALSFAAYESFI